MHAQRENAALRQHVLDLRRGARAAGVDLNSSATFLPIPVRSGGQAVSNLALNLASNLQTRELARLPRVSHWCCGAHARMQHSTWIHR